MRFCLFSNNYRLARLLTLKGNLVQVICESKHFNCELYNFLGLHDIPAIFVSDRKDLDEKSNTFIDADTGISYGTGIIFKKSHISRFTNGIWNIHPGKLPENRGRHPIAWDFLNNKTRFTISIHSINEAIDQGILLGQASIVREINDTEETIIARLISEVENHLFDEAISNYNNKNYIEIPQGTYNPTMAGRYSDIDPAEYSAKFIFNLFKSQYRYGGIKLNGKQYLNCHFYHKDFSNHFSGYDIYECKDMSKIAVNNDRNYF